MTVKELITKLLDEEMNTEIRIALDDKHIDKNGNEVLGYLFDIEQVRHWNRSVELVFIDYRKENNYGKCN